MKNFFEDIPKKLPQELTECILEAKNVRIERIVSKGHASPQGFWYDQDENEWVILLSGMAVLEFEGEKPIKLFVGDNILIPARKKHRVLWTHPEFESVWLAVFYKDD